MSIKQSDATWHKRQRYNNCQLYSRYVKRLNCLITKCTNIDSRLIVSLDVLGGNPQTHSQTLHCWEHPHMLKKEGRLTDMLIVNTVMQQSHKFLQIVLYVRLEIYGILCNQPLILDVTRHLGQIQPKSCQAWASIRKRFSPSAQKNTFFLLLPLRQQGHTTKLEVTRLEYTHDHLYVLRSG